MQIILVLPEEHTGRGQEIIDAFFDCQLYQTERNKFSKSSELGETKNSTQ